MFLQRATARLASRGFMARSAPRRANDPQFVKFNMEMAQKWGGDVSSDNNNIYKLYFSLLFHFQRFFFVLFLDDRASAR